MLFDVRFIAKKNIEKVVISKMKPKNNGCLYQRQPLLFYHLFEINTTQHLTFH